MPQWAGSSWYYLRYMDPKNSKALVDPKKEQYWNTVDFYVGGAEHATRHLIYARFWHKFLYDIGAVSTIEPFRKLQSVGLIMGEDGLKMSKRLGNVVNPDDIIAAYGADTMRIYEMFMGPFDQAIAWSTKGMVGSRRFIERVWKLRAKVAKNASLPKQADILLNKTIAKVTEDIAMVRHNTAISALMILSNEFETCETLPRDAYETLLKLLAPFAPHVTEELWADLGNKKSIHVSPWPIADQSKIAEETVTIAVQVNGKTRATFQSAKTASREELEKTALGLDDVKKWLAGKQPRKNIIVPGRLVSLVV
jgi:leucyl-tRNA synthetase